MDVMCVFNRIKVVHNVKQMNHSERCTNLLMEDNMEIPGFSRLKLIPDSDETINEALLSTKWFIRQCIELNKNFECFVHGPCLCDSSETVDVAFCFHSYSWPRQAKQWIYRHRPGQWPPDILIDEIVNYGCILVPIGPKDIESNDRLWRISFSMAEKQLSHAMNYTQILCYALLKLSLKNIIDRNDEVKGLLCSYFMKTALFWLSEEIPTSEFQLQNLFHCYFLCLDKIISWVRCCYCPNYFIPQHNMFRGKLNWSNSRLLLNVLERLRKCERGVFTVNALFNSEALLHDSCIRLEMFLYRFIDRGIEFDIKKGYTLLNFIKSLAMSHSSSILSGICKYYYAMISQNIVQKLPFPTTNKLNVRVIRRYHKHLYDGTKSDAVSGWLLYASFYYVLGQYNATLKIIDHVLSRCTPDMMMLTSADCTTNDINYYKQNVGCSTITLNEKMRLATITDVWYVQQSTLIPHELKLEVQNDTCNVPPVVMSHCLRFLCYHHLCDIVNRQQSLSDLFLTIIKKHFIKRDLLSNSITIVGVCYEIAGNKKKARYSYDAALGFSIICSSAAERKANLRMT